MTAQTRINEIQALYKEWLAVHERLQTVTQDLVKSNELMKELENFYFNGEYREIFEQIENGLEVDLTTSGEYGIMGEDTLWNAFCDERVFYETLLEIAKEQLAKMDNNES